MAEAETARGVHEELDRLGLPDEWIPIDPAGDEARCRLRLGRLAAAFLARPGHRRLGFARLGDYTREGLGLGGDGDSEAEPPADETQRPKRRRISSRRRRSRGRTLTRPVRSFVST